VEKRKNWANEKEAFDIDRLVFIDESGVKTNESRFFGRAFRGERVRDYAPCGSYKSVTMVSSVRIDGSTACMTFEGSLTGEIFKIYVEQVLIPTLRPGDIVVMDNLSSHKNKDALNLIQNAGAEVRFLPPYSPDFNPIEKMWSKVKQSLRSLKSRTLETLIESIGLALDFVTAKDALGWFTSCGYQ